MRYSRIKTGKLKYHTNAFTIWLIIQDENTLLIENIV